MLDTPVDPIPAARAAASRNRIQRNVLGALLTFCVVLPASAQVTFDVSFDASADVLTPTEKDNVTSHLRAAGDKWIAHLLIAGPRSIEIRVFIDNIPTANGASATTGFIGVLDGRDTYEQGVAYELRTGVDPTMAIKMPTSRSGSPICATSSGSIRIRSRAPRRSRPIAPTR